MSRRVFQIVSVKGSRIEGQPRKGPELAPIGRQIH